MSRMLRLLVTALAVLALTAAGAIAALPAAAIAGSVALVDLALDQAGPIEPANPVIARVTAKLAVSQAPLQGTLAVTVRRTDVIPSAVQVITLSSGRAEQFATGRSIPFTPLEGGQWRVTAVFTPDAGNPQGVKAVTTSADIRVLRADTVFHVDPFDSSFQPGENAPIIASLTGSQPGVPLDGFVRVQIDDGPSAECTPVAQGGLDASCTVVGLRAPTEPGDHTITGTWTGSTFWATKVAQSTLVVAAAASTGGAGGGTGGATATGGGTAGSAPTADPTTSVAAPDASPAATATAVSTTASGDLDVDPASSTSRILAVVVIGLVVLLAGAIILFLLRRRATARGPRPPSGAAPS